MKATAMEPHDPTPEKEKKISHLEQELSDLRQGLAVVTDVFHDLEDASKKMVATEEIDQELIKPLVDDELEFESIWSFHEDILIPESAARISCTGLYEAFVQYCTMSGRSVVEQDAFEFVFAHMENPRPALDRGEWVGYRLRKIPQ